MQSELEEINTRDIQDSLKSMGDNNIKYQYKLQEATKELSDFNNKIGHTTTLDFQQSVVERVEPVFSKYNNMYSLSYSQDASLDYPLYHSKKAFKANKIFHIISIRKAIEKNTLLVYLEYLISDLNYYKEKSFTSEFYSEMKTKLPKYLRIVKQYVFDFEENCQESILFTNRVKRRKQRRKNIPTMEIL